MVDALGKSELEDLCLQPPLQEIFNLQTQDVIKLHLTLIQHTNPDQTPEQSITWTSRGTVLHFKQKHPYCALQLGRTGLIDEEFLTPEKSDI